MLPGAGSGRLGLYGKVFGGSGGWKGLAENGDCGRVDVEAMVHGFAYKSSYVSIGTYLLAILALEGDLQASEYHRRFLRLLLLEGALLA